MLGLSFRSEKDLRNRAKMLQKGPGWKCLPITTVYPTKNKINLYYRDPIECLQLIMRNPLLKDQLEFEPYHIFKTAEKTMRIYTEWLSGNAAWEMQVRIFIFGIVFPDLLCTTTEEFACRIDTLGYSFIIRQDKGFSNNRRSLCPSPSHQSSKCQERFSKQGLKPRLPSPSPTSYSTFSSSQQEDTRRPHFSALPSVSRHRPCTVEGSRQDWSHDVRSTRIQALLFYTPCSLHRRHS